MRMPPEVTKFKTKPYKHQLECLNRFGRSPYFALLAEQGTGKTFIVINNIADLWASGDCDAALVLAPNGVHTNWTILELPKHMPDWVRCRATAWDPGTSKKNANRLEAMLAQQNGELRILTMNWDALQTPRGLAFAEKFAKSAKKLMIACDESDAVKNPSASRTKALMKLKSLSVWRRIMTGTPVNNAPFDLFSQFMFLDEKILKTTSYYAFKAEYSELLKANHHVIQHIVKGKNKMADYDRREVAQALDTLKIAIYKNGRAELIEALSSVVDAHEAANYERMPQLCRDLQGMFAPGEASPNSLKAQALRASRHIEAITGNYVAKLNNAFNPNRLPQIVDKDGSGRPKYRNLDKLSELIAPHSFRVLKKDCLDLPDKIYKTLFFELTQQQREVYAKAEKECRLVFEGNETPFAKLNAVTKLAQITSGYYIHPASEQPVRIDGENPKLELLVDRVKAVVAAGEKIIVWAQFRVEIEDICTRLSQEGLNLVQYHGGVARQDRVDAIEAFQNGDADVFVGNQKAGGTGITLIAASFVAYFSNNYSLRDRLQSEDRAHRIGQTKNVTYYNFAGVGTVDEKVIFALMNKKDVAETIIDLGLAMFAPSQSEGSV